MVGQEVVVHAWKEWSIRALVLLSFTLQVMLLVLATFRRRVRSGKLMFFVWSAYMLADATAIYVLGHMSVTSSSSPEHQLVAFWAPFLLLHLGGQDNITAYAIEDNRLWLRHLQALVVQASAAAYVLYESSVITGGQPLLRWAAILMFLVGAVKYGERVCALWLASGSSPGKNYQTLVMTFVRSVKKSFLDNLVSEILDKGLEGPKTEGHIVMAHQMLHVPKCLLKGSLPGTHVYRLNGARLYKVVEMQLSLMHDIFYTKTPIIHSSWYGICIHVISAVATATAFLLFNLQIWNDHGKVYNRVDVAVTYVLLVGAFVLETLSLLRAAFSSWIYSHRYDWDNVPDPHPPPADPEVKMRLVYIISAIRQFVRAADWQGRYWSASMGQHNLLQLSVRSRARCSKVARWMRLEDPWNTLAYSWSIPVSAFIEDRLVNRFLNPTVLQESERQRLIEMRAAGGEEERDEERGDQEVVLEINEEEGGPHPHLGEEEAKELLRVWDLERIPAYTIQQLFRRPLAEIIDKSDRFHVRVPVKLRRWGLYTFGLTRSIEERILVWHIATNIYLTWWYQQEQGKQPNKEEHGTTTTTNKQQQPKNKAEAYKMEHSKQPTAEVVEALSNYMVFLLTACPDMLTPTGSRSAYVEVCYALAICGPECETAEELATKLRNYGDAMLDRPENYQIGDVIIDDPCVHGFDSSPPLILQIGCKLGAMLVRKHAADTMDAVAKAWVETLGYAAQGCTAYAHAKQLSNGGELITVAAILLEYDMSNYII